MIVSIITVPDWCKGTYTSLTSGSGRQTNTRVIDVQQFEPQIPCLNNTIIGVKFVVMITDISTEGEDFKTRLHARNWMLNQCVNLLALIRGHNQAETA